MNLLTVGERLYNEQLQWFGKCIHRKKKKTKQIIRVYVHNFTFLFFSDEKVKQKIERIFRIWEQRNIYNEEFLSDLHGLLSINPAKKPQPNETDDEQASITVANIKNCVRLEKETDKCFKLLSRTLLCDTETLNSLKGNYSYIRTVGISDLSNFLPRPK